MDKLIINGLCKKFGNQVVLNHASTEFEEGKIYSILGRNGAGKTTFFKCINHDLPYEGGEISLITEGNTRPVQFGDIGLVSASPVLPEFLTGYEFIRFFIKLNQESSNPASIADFFDLVNICEADQHKLIRSYSYGMKNKLQLLCCLIRNPKIILLDEPLSSFDIIVSHEIKELLVGMKKTHIIVMATHIMQLAQDISDEIVLLKNGEFERPSITDIHSPDFETQIISELNSESGEKG